MTVNPDFNPEPLLRQMDKALTLPFMTHNFDDVVQCLRDGHMQMFWNEDAVIITEICVTPRRRFLNIFLAAGKLKALDKLRPQIVAFARKNQLSEAQGTMRLGWGGALTKRGWTKQAEIWNFPVENWDNG